MRAISQGNLLLSRIFYMPVSSAPIPPTPPPVLRQTNFLEQADAASKMSIPLPPGAVPMGDGALRDSYIINVPAETMQAVQAVTALKVEPLTEASLPDWDAAVKVLESDDVGQIVTLIQSVSPAMAALLMAHVVPKPGIYAQLIRRLVLLASDDILQTAPDDEPVIEDAEG